MTLIASLQAAIRAQPPAVSDWNVRDHLRPQEIIVQSHRGAGELAPENTAEAFELGWSLGTYPEADVRTTSDGVIVAFHDANFKRVVKDVPPELADKGVKDVTMDELRKLDVGSYMENIFHQHRVCTMAEIFTLMKGHPNRHLYMDIKDVDLKQLAALVQEHEVTSQVLLASPRHDELVQWKRMLPDSQTLLWIGGKTEAEQKEKFESARARKFEGLTQVQIHTHLETDATSITRASVKPFRQSEEFLISAGLELREHGVLFQTLCYGGTTKEIFWKLLDLGLMSFSTDHPKVTRDAITEYYSLPAGNSQP